MAVPGAARDGRGRCGGGGRQGRGRVQRDALEHASRGALTKNVRNGHAGPAATSGLGRGAVRDANVGEQARAWGGATPGLNPPHGRGHVGRGARGHLEAHPLPHAGHVVPVRFIFAKMVHLQCFDIFGE